MNAANTNTNKLNYFVLLNLTIQLFLSPRAKQGNFLAARSSSIPDHVGWLVGLSVGRYVILLTF